MIKEEKIFSLVSLIVLSSTFVISSATAEKEDLTWNPDAKQKAIEHLNMMENFTCKFPVPKLFVVGGAYPVTNGRYKPHCVVLHRCDNDAGCCQNDATVCAPSKTEIVNLHINMLVYNPVSSRVQRKVFQMSFENHTDCECQNIRGKTVME